MVQFACYLPYGEALADEHTVTETQPYKFSGKELDGETGLYYFGARYYNPRSAIWYGVDALAENTPDRTPYHYCSSNPVSRVDPDGNSDDFYLDLNSGRIAYKEGSKSRIDEGLVRLAGDNATVGGVENSLKSKGYAYRKDVNVAGGFRVDTEAAYKGWIMMQVFSPDNVATVFGVAGLENGGGRLLKSSAKANARLIVGKIRTAAAKTVPQYTKSSLQFGQQMHKAYNAGKVGKEFRLLSGKRIDYLDIQNGIIYELKPFNPRAMKAGQNQLNMYLKELQSPAMLQKYPEFRGVNWKTVLDTY